MCPPHRPPEPQAANRPPYIYVYRLGAPAGHVVYHTRPRCHSVVLATKYKSADIPSYYDLKLCRHCEQAARRDQRVAAAHRPRRGPFHTLTAAERLRICRVARDGGNLAALARDMGRSHSTVKRVAKEFDATGRVLARKRGRPHARVLSDTMENAVVQVHTMLC